MYSQPRHTGPFRRRAMEADGPDGPVDSLRSAQVGNEPTRPLESLRLPTGPWTRFEVDRVGHASTAPTAPFFLSIGREPERRELLNEPRREDSEQAILTRRRVRIRGWVSEAFQPAIDFLISRYQKVDRLGLGRPASERREDYGRGELGKNILPWRRSPDTLC